MSTELISIEKGKYTTLLRRVLGMQVSENGVISELDALTNKFLSVSRDLNYRKDDQVRFEEGLENLGFAMEYYHLRKEDFWVYGECDVVEENQSNMEC